MYFKFLAFILLYSILKVLSSNETRSRHCLYIKEDDYTHCTDDLVPISDLMQEHLLHRNITKSKELTCKNENVCRRKFSITCKHEMHSVHLLTLLNQVLDACCGDCAAYHTYKIIRHFGDLRHEDVFRNSDLIFPIIGERAVTRMFGMYFIPIIEISCSYYLTREKTGDENLIFLVKACLQSWPLVVFCMLLSIIAGFVIWILERENNRGEFPKRFITGLYEGIWWSFVSITTVGYGDRTPRSVLGRVFSVIWILIGIGLFAVLTGSLTNEITTLSAHKPPDVHGKTVAGLQHQFEASIMVANQGGIYQAHEYNETVEGVMQLLRMLKNKEIHGIMLSSMTYSYFRLAVRNKTDYLEYTEEYENMGIHLSERRYQGESSLATGMLVKDEQVYEYFRSYFQDNWITIQNCASYYRNKKMLAWSSEPHLSYVDHLFMNFVYAVLAILLGIFVIGFLLEVKHRFHRDKCDTARTDDGRFMIGILSE